MPSDADPHRSAAGAGGPGPASGGRRRSPLRKIGRAAAWTVIGLVGLVVLVLGAALVLLQTDWGRERVRVFALERLRGMVHGSVEVARLGGDFLHGITLDGVSITGPGNEPFLSLRRLELTYEPGGFLRRKILLGNVDLIEPRIMLAQDSTGDWNALRILPMLRPKAPAPPEKPGGWGSVLSVGRLRISGAAVSVSTAREGVSFGPLGTRVELTGLNGEGHAQIAPIDEGRPEAGSRKAFDVTSLQFALPRQAFEVREIDLGAVLTPDGLDLHRLLVRTPSSRLTAKGTVRNLTSPVLDLALQAEPLALGDVRTFTPRVTLEGSLTGKLHVEGPMASPAVTVEDAALATARSRIELSGTITTERGPEVDARLELAPLDPADARALAPAYPLLEPLRGSVSAKGSREDASVEGQVAFGRTMASLSGRVGLPGDAPVYDLRLAVTGLDLAEVMADPRYASDLNGEVRAAGRGKEGRVEAALKVSRVMGYRLAAASLRGRIAAETVRIEKLQVGLSRSQVSASGTVPLRGPVDVRFSAVSRNLQDFRPSGPSMPVRRFELRGLVTGTVRALAARVEVSADSLAAGGAVIGRLHSTGMVEGLGRPSLRASADGTLEDLVAGGTPVDSVRFAADYVGATGEISLSAAVDSLRRADAHVELDLRGASPVVVLDSLSLARGDEVWALRAAGRLVARGGTLEFDRFELAQGEQAIAADGMLGTTGRQDLRLDLRNLSLEALERLAGVPPSATGVLSGQVSLTGTASAPTLQGEVALERGRIGAVALRRLGGKLDYAGRRLTLDVEIVPDSLAAEGASAGGVAPRDPGSLRIQGDIPVDLAFTGVRDRFPDAPLDVRVESRNLSPTLLGGVAPPAGAELAPLEIQAHLTGRPSAPVLESRFALGESRVPGLAIHRLAGRVDYAEREATLDVTLEPGAAGPDSLRALGSISLRGTLPVDLSLGPVERRLPERPIDLSLESHDLTLAALSAASPRIVEASGPVQVGVRLQGTPADPRYDGRISVTGGAFRNGPGGARYSGITGEILFDNDRISIPELRVSSSGGSARLSGEVALRELTLGDVQGRLTARDFTLLDENAKALVVDADLRLSGTTEQPSVAGSVSVDRFEWPIPERSDKEVIDLDQAIFYVRASTDTLATEGPPPSDVWGQTALDVDVDIHHDAVLKNEKTLVAAQGDLSIDKARGEARPSIAGTLDVTRGFYADFGKRFEIQHGEVRFFGTPEPDPALDVTAVTTVKNADTGGDVEVALTLGGTASAPTLDVSSEPEYDKSEIFSLLLFGTTTPGQGQQGKLEDTLGRLAAGQASAPLTRALSAELGLDLLEIQPGIGSEGGAGFRAGKYISPDVFVTYTQGSGPNPENQLGVQYRLTRRLDLQTRTSTRQFGADLFYEFEY